jgi:hypothetical protein
VAPPADLVGRARAWWRARFDGLCSPWCYALLRIAVALLVLVRTTDWLRPVVSLYHQTWMRGLEYDPGVEAVALPALRSPLVAGLALGAGVSRALVLARTALAFLLLLGIRPQLTAGALALAGGALLAADRYRYLHHLHLLWLTVGWLALAPSGERLSVASLWRRDGARPTELVPRWPLQLLRLQTVAVFAAAGAAKLDADWLSGKTLSELGQLGLIGGAVWHRALALLGARGLGIAICATELTIAGALLVPGRVRAAGVGLAVAFFAGISATMSVATFGAQMLTLVLLFLPWREVARDPAPLASSDPSVP